MAVGVILKNCTAHKFDSASYFFFVFFLVRNQLAVFYEKANVCLFISSFFSFSSLVRPILMQSE